MCIAEWAESEKLTPNPDSKTETPDPVSLQILHSGFGPCPSLPCYLLIQYIPVPVHEQQTCKPVN